MTYNELSRNYEHTVRVSGESLASDSHPDHNEDRYILSDTGYAGVFDGMGGHSGSEAAAGLVSQYCDEALGKMRRELDPATAKDCLECLLIDANGALYEAEKHRGYLSIGTTAILAVVFTDPSANEQFCVIPYAGDSRGHVVVDGSIVETTLDHAGSTLYLPVAEQQRIQHVLATERDGEALDDLLRAHLMQRNIIASCLTSDQPRPRRIDSLVVPVVPGTKVLLTSDGVHDNLTTDEIEHALQSDAAVRTLVQHALERSREPETLTTKDGEHIWNFRAKPDDITAVMLEF